MRHTISLACLLSLSLIVPACDSDGGGGSSGSGDFTVVPPSNPDATDAASDTLVSDSTVVVTDAGSSLVDAGPVADTAAPADIVADASPVTPDTSVAPEDTAGPTASQFVGRWALRYWVNTLTEVPVVGGTMETKVLTLGIVEITDTDTGLNLANETCSVEMISEEGALAETILPDAFVNSIPVANRPAVLTDDGAGFFCDTFYEVRGANLEDLANEALPTEPNDPRVFDQDGDGHPGMTISVTGLADGDIYLVQRGWNKLQTTSSDGTRIFGTTEWGDEQSYLDASSLILKSLTPVSWPDPDPSKHGWELVYAPDINCNQVIGTAASIFESE